MDFAEKVKKARRQLGISQETLSKEIGVSFGTVNRWESGKCFPSYKAQKSFEEFCTKRNVDFSIDN